ncbi:tRNA(His) guanylyltransferase Thg1 family protein [Methanolobus halotolerans]|uniref:tRNA(His) guanylyltransferase n=1 Tax=Methanolobus halotolerans TaxID=2052935 RepID=A0A4E0Q7R2_9EURY|nr:tRNA(His) guanylyltransferase Thg1 family protein [Methanolobus halotolerans]TGC10990.1 tRNA 5'-guanylyltransferase [Methanolobus halotolerans]
MKGREIYSDLRCAPPVIVRIDGRSFKNALSRMEFEKPYDSRFASAMADAVELFFRNSGFSPVFAYVFSDEISFFFREVAFEGRVEKIDSIVPSFISSALTMLLGSDEPLSFDSRVIPVHGQIVSDYLIWRQAEAWRNCVNSHAYYALLSEGLEEEDAAGFLRNKGTSDMHELLFSRGTNVAKLPAWQRRGMMVVKEEYKVEGFNPHLDERTLTTRRKVVQNWDIPQFRTPEGACFVKDLICPENGRTT